MCLGAHQGAGMRFIKSWLIAKLCLLLVLPAAAWSQALSQPKPDNVGRAVSGALQEGMRARGFAANDPRFGNTLARISPHLSVVAGGSAAAITAGAVTAPAWASVALAAGVGAVITYAVSLGVEALVNWLFRSDGKIDQSSDVTAERDPSFGVSAGRPAWRANVWTDRYTFHTAWGGDGYAMAKESYYSRRSVLGEDSQNVECYAKEATVVFCGFDSAVLDAAGPPNACPRGSFFTEAGGCSGYTFPVANVVDDRNGLSPQDAIYALPEAVLEQPLNPAIVAALANQAWQQAASEPGYDGLPYPQSNPITQSEVQPWLQANPQYAPTVRDFVSPNPVTGSAPYPWALPSNPTAANPSPSVPNAGSTNPAQDNPQANLGPDPGIGSPTLETVPTAQQIANPILQLAPDLRAFQASNHAGVCPRPTIELYGTHVLDAHCRLIEDNKQVLQLAMAFAWAAMALFVVLSA